MIYLLGPKRVVWAISTLAVALVCLWTLANPAPDAIEVWKWRGWILVVLSGLVSILAFRPILWIVHKVTFGDRWWFPWLGGPWTGEVRSNWPIVEGMLLAQKSTEPVIGDKTREPLPVAIDADIKVGLFDMEIVLRPTSTQRISRTLFVRPSWSKPTLPTIHYIYEQRDGGTVAPTDRRTHFGAARLSYDPDTCRLEGDYWTERSADLGLNTAGTITLRRSA